MNSRFTLNRTICGKYFKLCNVNLPNQFRFFIENSDDQSTKKVNSQNPKHNMLIFSVHYHFYKWV